MKTSIGLSIQKSGQLTSIEFYHKRTEFKKIAKLSDQELSIGVAILFGRIAVFTGLKGGIDDFIKQDILNGLVTNHRHLSLEEIEYAFCLDRDGVYGEPTNHYQFINREYVGRVLKKYYTWLDSQRQIHRIPVR